MGKGKHGLKLILQQRLAAVHSKAVNLTLKRAQKIPELDAKTFAKSAVPAPFFRGYIWI